jgi:hypothetical protein
MEECTVLPTEVHVLIGVQDAMLDARWVLLLSMASLRAMWKDCTGLRDGRWLTGMVCNLLAQETGCMNSVTTHP